MGEKYKVKHKKRYIVIILCIVNVLKACSVKSNQENELPKVSPEILYETPDISGNEKILDFKGDSSIIVTIAPSVSDEGNWYLIELFEDGKIETTVKNTNKDIYWKEFDEIKNIFNEQFIDNEIRMLNKEEIKTINNMMDLLVLENVDDEFLKKRTAQDAHQEMIYIQGKAYYFLGIHTAYDEITRLMKEIIAYSPITVKVR